MYASALRGRARVLAGRQKKILRFTHSPKGCCHAKPRQTPHHCLTVAAICHACAPSASGCMHSGPATSHGMRSAYPDKSLYSSHNHPAQAQLSTQSTTMTPQLARAPVAPPGLAATAIPCTAPALGLTLTLAQARLPRLACTKSRLSSTALVALWGPTPALPITTHARHGTPGPRLTRPSSQPGHTDHPRPTPPGRAHSSSTSPWLLAAAMCASTAPVSRSLASTLSRLRTPLAMFVRAVS